MTVQSFKSICQKSEDENYLFDKYIFRRISIFGTMFFAKLGVAPNTVTFLSLLSSLSSLWFFLQNDSVYLVAAAALIFFYHYLDHVDGELARYYSWKTGKKNSMKGAYFDLLCHQYSVNLYFLCISVALYKELQSDWVILVGVIAVVGTSSFPRLIAGKALLNKICADRTVVNEPGMSDALEIMNKKGEQIHAVRSAKLFSKAKIKKLAEESIGYPGIINLLVIACLVDAYFQSYYCRMALLCLTAAVRLVHSPILARRFMRALDQVY